MLQPVLLLQRGVRDETTVACVVLGRGNRLTILVGEDAVRSNALLAQLLDFSFQLVHALRELGDRGWHNAS